MKAEAATNFKLQMSRCINSDHTSRVGFVYGVSFEEMKKVFGKPQMIYPFGEKTQVEWIGRINGEVFTIYDYKSEVDYQENTEWHIGARSDSVYENLKHYYEANQ